MGEAGRPKWWNDRRGDVGGMRKMVYGEREGGISEGVVTYETGVESRGLGL